MLPYSPPDVVLIFNSNCCTALPLGPVVARLARSAALLVVMYYTQADTEQASHGVGVPILEFSATFWGHHSGASFQITT